MVGSIRAGLSLGVWLVFWWAPALADCVFLERIEALDRLGRVVIEAPSAENRAALEREIAETRRNGLALDGAAREGKSISASVAIHLAALSLLVKDGEAASGSAERRLEASAGNLRRRAETMGCGEEPGVEVVGVAPAGQADGVASGGPRRVRPEGPEPAGLAVLGIGAVSIPALLLPSILVLLRRHKVRQGRRRSTRYVTTIRFGEKDFACMIIDASRRGLRITMPERLPRSGNATIVLPDRTATAAVRWRTDYQAGLQLEKPLRDETLQALERW